MNPIPNAIDKLSVWEILDTVGLPATLGNTIPVVELPLTDEHPWWACLCDTCTQMRDSVTPTPDEKPRIGRAALASHTEHLINDTDCCRIARWLLPGNHQ